MFHSTAMLCRFCGIKTVGRRVICLDCIGNDDVMPALLERAKIATAMYSDYVDILPPEEAQRWGVVLDHAAKIDTLPRLNQTSAAIQFRKRLDLTAETADVFGICTGLYIRYREACHDVDAFGDLLWYVDAERAKRFDAMRNGL